MVVRVVSCLCCLATVCLGVAHVPAHEPKTKDDGVHWVDVKSLGLEGQGWADVKAPYDRLPARAEGKVPDAVWKLSRHSAGLCVRFVTDAPTIRARWTVTNSKLEMPHMAATGVSGIDLYARDEHGKWRWVAVGQPRAAANNVVLAKGIKPRKREYLVYLPLYNETASAELGVPTGSVLERAPAYPAERAKPIVYYGTSITHGACASRPGMAHTAILQRRYDRPAINLGFSGNGRMEPEVTAFLAELDPAAYVIDCCPNLSGPETAARTKPLVAQLRKAHPQTPIILVEDRRFSDAWLIGSRSERNDGNHAALTQAFKELLAAGENNLYYIPGDDLLGDDGEGTVDASHPNDLGFMRQADAFDKVLGPVLTGHAP